MQREQVRHTAGVIVDGMVLRSSRTYHFDSNGAYFISGRMSGMVDWNRKAFNECEKAIRKMATKATIFNPAAKAPVDDEEPKPYTHYMLETLSELTKHDEGDLNTPKYDAVVLLPHWEDSLGAVTEAITAFECGIDMVLWTE